MKIDIILKPDNTFVETVHPEICGPCGGYCCKHLPGISSPEQWGRNEAEILKNLIRGLASKQWSVDWWEGDPREGKSWEDDDYIGEAYFIRPATTNNVRGIKDPSWGGQCVFLKDEGCSFKFENRPLGCRALKPSKSHRCGGKDDTGGKQEMALAWLPYNAIIDQAIDKAQDIIDGKAELETDDEEGRLLKL